MSAPVAGEVDTDHHSVGPGGSTDIVGRLLAADLTKKVNVDLIKSFAPVGAAGIWRFYGFFLP